MVASTRRRYASNPQHLVAQDFVGLVAEKASGSKNRKVVLFCGGPDCDASSKEVKLLRSNGFTCVSDYEGGLASRRESGGTRAGKGKA